jgi:hypothetical protein
VWKWVLIWCSDAVVTFGTLFIAQAPESPNPIQYAYDAANKASTLTDRALWLFLLGIILTYVYFNDRKKDREIKELREWRTANTEKLITTLEEANRHFERMERRQRSG